MPEVSSERAESVLYKAFNSSINIIMTISTIEKGVFIDVNKAFLKLSGFTKDEVIGRSSEQLGIISSETRDIMKQLLIEKGQVENFEIIFKSKDQKLSRLLLFTEIITIDGDQQLFTIVHDITELVVAKSELEKEKAILQAVFDSTPDAFVLKDCNSVYLKVNPAFCNFFDVKESQAVGKNDFDFFPQSEAAKFRKEDQKIIKTGITSEYDRELKTSNHGAIWYQTIKTPIKDSNGSIAGILCSARDITKRKYLEDMHNVRLCISNYSYSNSIQDLFQKILSESERLTQSQISFFHFEDDINNMLHFNTWSANAMKIFNMKINDPSPYLFEKWGLFADCARIRKPIILNDYKNFEGKKIPCLHPHIKRLLTIPVFEGGNIVAFLGVGNKHNDYDQDDIEVVNELAKMAWDILRRKEAEMKFIESQRLIKTLINNLPGILFRCRVDSDMHTNIEFISDGCTAITGYRPDEFTDNAFNFFDIVHPDDCKMIAGMVSDFFNNNKPYDAEFRIINKNKSVRWVWGRGSAVSSKEGISVTIEGIVTDITELRNKDNELRRFASAINQVAEIIVITDIRGVIKYVNPSFEKITGFSSSDVIGRSVSLIKSGEHNDYFYRQLWETIESGRIWYGRFINKKKDGTFYTEEASISPVFDVKGVITEFVAVKRDITNEILLEAKFSQAQKMEAIGALAGGIAHDFNNILFPLIGFSEILQQDLHENSPLHDYVSEILTASMRAKELVKQILAFSRQSKQEKKVTRIQNILNEVIRFSRATLPSTISVRTYIEKDCRPIIADPTQIHQIAMNLITNALHAMEDAGGVLSISLKEVVLDSVAAKKASLKEGLHVCLTVSDTGCGIDPTIKDKIFDPYFTTKGVDKGTGIGLAVVHGIINSHGGSIDLQSYLGEGTSFIIYFPCMFEEKNEEIEKYVPIASRGNEKILVVDDEEAVAKMIRQMLERLGYSVTFYTNSTEALQRFKDDPFRFDLVITDMTMPILTGDLFSLEIKRIRNDIPIIICTGFSEKMNAAKAEKMEIEGFVLKPILQNELANMIRQIIDNKKKCRNS